jgi:hypothetical protein
MNIQGRAASKGAASRSQQARLSRRKNGNLARQLTATSLSPARTQLGWKGTLQVDGNGNRVAAPPLDLKEVVVAGINKVVRLDEATSA